MDIIDRAARAVEALGPMNVANRFDREQVIRAVLETLLEPTDEMARGAQATGMGLVTPEARKEMFAAMIAVTLK